MTKITQEQVAEQCQRTLSTIQDMMAKSSALQAAINDMSDLEKIEWLESKGDSVIELYEGIISFFGQFDELSTKIADLKQELDNDT